MAYITLLPSSLAIFYIDIALIALIYNLTTHKLQRRLSTDYHKQTGCNYK